MALSFIGKPISLISHSDVRYRGILAGIDPAASTIQLSNVYSMGTETRRPANQYLPPNPDPYGYIIFKASEVKDLSVDESVAPARNIHDDPAVMASAPIANNGYGGYAPPPGGPVPPQAAPGAQQQYPPRPPQQQPLPQQPVQQQPTPAGAPDAPNASQAPRTQSAQNRRPNPVHTAAASMETVERALGDLRVSNGASSHHTGGRGGRRGGHHQGGHQQQPPLTVPKTDFDFASSNAKFDKSAVAAAVSPAGGDQDASGGEEAQGEEGEESKEKKEKTAYNPQKSFFDTLSSNTAPEPSRGGAPVGGGRGARGGRGGRSRRDEEREKNVATFGEPGGVGLMGPGAYVGGWGGYGRRGGRRGRGGGRGGGGGGHGNPNNHTQPVQARG